MIPDISVFYLPNGNMKRQILKSKNNIIQQKIKEVYKYTSFIKKHNKENTDFNMRVIYIRDKIDIKCKYCEKNRIFSHSQYRWLYYCGTKCASIDRIKNSKITHIKKYGEKGYLGSPIFLNKKIVSHKLSHISNIDFFYDKVFIEKNFIDSNGIFDKYSFMTFFNCQQTAANKKLKQLNITYKKQYHGFNKNNGAFLYYIIIDNKYFKIGITSNTVKERFKKEDFSRIKILFTQYFKIGEDALSKEQFILKKFKKYLLNDKTILKDGNTEIFFKNILNKEIK